MAVDIDTLRKLTVSAKTIDVPGVGEFRYRGLTRNEAVGMAEVEGGVAVQESRLLALCVVEPKLTEAEWSELGDTLPAGVLAPLAEAIAEASGADPGAAKAAYARFRDR